MSDDIVDVIRGSAYLLSRESRDAAAAEIERLRAENVALRKALDLTRFDTEVIADEHPPAQNAHSA